MEIIILHGQGKVDPRVDGQEASTRRMSHTNPGVSIVSSPSPSRFFRHPVAMVPMSAVGQECKPECLPRSSTGQDTEAGGLEPEGRAPSAKAECLGTGSGDSNSGGPEDVPTRSWRPGVRARGLRFWDRDRQEDKIGEDGMSLAYVSEFLGHAQLTTTSRYIQASRLTRP